MFSLKAQLNKEHALQNIRKSASFFYIICKSVKMLMVLLIAIFMLIGAIWAYKGFRAWDLTAFKKQIGAENVGVSFVLRSNMLKTQANENLTLNVDGKLYQLNLADDEVRQKLQDDFALTEEQAENVRIDLLIRAVLSFAVPSFLLIATYILVVHYMEKFVKLLRHASPFNHEALAALRKLTIALLAVIPIRFACKLFVQFIAYRLNGGMADNYITVLSGSELLGVAVAFFLLKLLEYGYILQLEADDTI